MSPPPNYCATRAAEGAISGAEVTECETCSSSNYACKFYADLETAKKACMSLPYEHCNHIHADLSGASDARYELRSHCCYASAHKCEGCTD